MYYSVLSRPSQTAKEANVFLLVDIRGQAAMMQTMTVLIFFQLRVKQSSSVVTHCVSSFSLVCHCKFALEFVFCQIYVHSQNLTLILFLLFTRACPDFFSSTEIQNGGAIALKK